MSITGITAAHGIKGRLLRALIVTVLLAGSLPVLYPFAVMVSGALRSEMDEAEMTLVPDYLVARDALVRKFLETKYGQDIGAFNRAHRRTAWNFRTAPVAPSDPGAAAEMRRFLLTVDLPEHWQQLGGLHGVRSVPRGLREFRRRLRDYYDGDLEALERDTGGLAPNWLTISVRPPDWLSPRSRAFADGPFEVYRGMLRESPPAERIIASLTGYYLESMVYPRYGYDGLDEFNAAHGTEMTGWDQLRLPRRAPPPDRARGREEWVEFVRRELNPSFVVVDICRQPEYRGFLRGRYETIAALNRAWGSAYRRFAEIELPAGEWLPGIRRVDYADYLQQVPADSLRLTGPEFAWADWLHRESTASGRLRPGDPMPVAALERDYVERRAGGLRWRYAVRNFVNVWDALVTEGRVLRNTVVFCALVIILNLLVNPMAAYALARFRLRSAYRLLLLLMATMAFPPMAMMIPQFLLLQRFNLVNTLPALLLPMIANGYFIFLLKGFFESLPPSLHEAATIDGASELRILFQLILPLSKPIMAVIALQAFTHAYTAFLYPLLVAPREDMWLISVWLYQYQEAASMSGVFASVLVAAIPTLVLFLLAQRIIMRGIVIPLEN